MTGFFYNLMFRVGSSKICSVWNKVVAKLMNIVFPLYCRMMPDLKRVNTIARAEGLIVSMTSFPARFNTLNLCIESILRQSYRPDKVILWLIESECQNIEIPNSLRALEKCGLEIRFAKDNLKPHNKFIYSAMEFKESLIITMDDDILYPSYTIEDLVKGHQIYPDCVICNMAHEITLNASGMPNPYSKWRGGAIGKTGPSHALAALGVGGVLYPANIFDDKYFNKELIKHYCLTADDLWLKYNEIRMDRKVYKVNAYAKNPVTLSKSQNIALTDINNGENKNDEIVYNLNTCFEIPWERIMEVV